MAEDKSEIDQLFNNIACSYDKLNHLLSLNIDRIWRRKLVKHLQPCHNMLDVAIGTADVSIAAIKHHKAEHITGIDISENMIYIGKQKVAERHLSNYISFVQGNAMRMPFTNGQYEAVCCAYGVRNFENMEQGLREMYRVLAPQGQLLILEFSYPTYRPVRWLYNTYFTHILPAIGRHVSKNNHAYTYLRNSVKEFVWGEAMVTRLREAGFTQISYKPLTFGITTLYTAYKI